MTYKVACQLCPEDCQAVYLGESARNLYTRGREHQSNYDKRSEESFMNKHQKDSQNNVEGDYKAVVKRSYNDCLSRQIAEGVLIRRFDNFEFEI